VIGGFTNLTGANVELAKVEAYDPTTDTWNTALADMPTARAGSFVGVVNNIIYVIGGNIGGPGGP